VSAGIEFELDGRRVNLAPATVNVDAGGTEGRLDVFAFGVDDEEPVGGEWLCIGELVPSRYCSSCHQATPEAEWAASTLLAGLPSAPVRVNGGEATFTESGGVMVAGETVLASSAVEGVRTLLALEANRRAEP
jgi:hypothetical protein